MRETSWLQEELNRAKKQGLTVHIEEIGRAHV